VTTPLPVAAPTWWTTAPRAARAWLLTLTLLGTVLRVVGIAHTSHTSVLNMPLADDAFYYFVLARNASAGQWPVISGDGAPTSGFQPLWGLAVAGLDVAAGGFSADGRIVAAQVAGALISLAAAILVLDLMRRLGAGWFASLLAFGAFVLSPQVLKHSLNGMETSLAMLAVVALVRLGATLDPARASSRSALLAGVVAGLGILARLDIVLLVAAAAGVTLAWRRPRPRGEAKRVAANALLAVGGAALPLITWTAVAIAAGAQSVPEAGSAVRNLALLLHDLPPASPLDSLRQPGVFVPVYAGYAVEFTSAWLRQIPVLLPLSLPLFALLPLRYALAASTVVAALAAAGVVAFAMRRGTEALRRLTAIWFLYALLMTIGYSCVILAPWFFQRYSAPVAVVFHILLLAAVGSLLQGASRRRAVGWLAALGVAAAFAALVTEGSYRWILSGPGAVPDDGWYRAAAIIDRELPPEARVGVFSAGLVTYYARQPVLALDGKVSSGARRAMEAGDMFGYICRQRIEFIADWEKMVESLLAQRSGGWTPADLEPIRTVRAPGYNDILIYRVASGACPPAGDDDDA